MVVTQRISSLRYGQSLECRTNHEDADDACSSRPTLNDSILDVSPGATPISGEAATPHAPLSLAVGRALSPVLISCYPSAGGRLRRQARTRTARAQGREHDYGLNPCVEPGWKGCHKSGRSAMTPVWKAQGAAVLPGISWGPILAYTAGLSGISRQALPGPRDTCTRSWGSCQEETIRAGTR
jgi:hypothetical protein